MAMAMAMSCTSNPHITTRRIQSSLPKFRPPACCLSVPGNSLNSSFTGGRIAVAEKKIAIQTLKNGGMQIRCQGSGIPAEYQWLKESIEKIGPDIFKKTYYPKAADHENAKKKWYIVDASDKVLGRLASTIAIHIRGKNLATYTPSVDMGAYVIVVNAEKVAVSGKKRQQKLYRRHSGRPGGLKVETFDQLQRRIPERIIEHAVRGMLPKGRLGRKLFTHLKVFRGPDHIHEAQRPEPLPIMDKRIMLKK